MRTVFLVLFTIFLTATSLMAETLACRGEDPFWFLDLDEDEKTADFTRIGDDPISTEIALTALAQGQNEIRAHSLANLSIPFTAIAVVAPASCQINDDDTYSHRIEILTQVQSEAILLSGCCRAEP